MFFLYSQNNSGGSFIVNENIGHEVIIEANDYNHANKRAEEIGIYFNGINDGMDCSCCCNRWDEEWSNEDATNEPEIYGKSIKDYKPRTWFEDEEIVMIYYLDGTKQRLVFTKK